MPCEKLHRSNIRNHTSNPIRNGFKLQKRWSSNKWGHTNALQTNRLIEWHSHHLSCWSLNCGKNQKIHNTFGLKEEFNFWLIFLQFLVYLFLCKMQIEFLFPLYLPFIYSDAVWLLQSAGTWFCTLPQRLTMQPSAALHLVQSLPPSIASVCSAAVAETEGPW